MSTWTQFGQSMLIGLSIAAPVGPIGLLTIQRSLEQGARAGFFTGLGAAVADAAYGAVGAFGVSWLIHSLTALRVPLAVGGAAFLLWMAWGLVRARPEAVQARSGLAGGSDWRNFGGTFLLTLANPATIISFIAVFGAMSAAGTRMEPATLVLGVFLGSALWWLFLSSAVGSLRERFDARWRYRIGLVSAAVLAGFALWQLAVAFTA